MRDMSQVEHTCPKIDLVIEFLQSIVWDENDDPDLKKQCDFSVEQMESLRNDNKALRAWGNEEYYLKAKYEEERDDLEKQLNEVKEENISYERKINNLEEKVEELESKVSNLEDQLVL